MRKDIEKNIESDLSDYFAHAKNMRCPPSMKKNLYQRVGMNNRRNWVPATAFAVVCALAIGLMMPMSRTSDVLPSDFNYSDASKDMQIAMHYMEKIGFKTLSGANSHGIMPGIIKPVSKTVSRI
ncbi:hypothetical protein [Marinicella sp. W31]|uniref:hypothetical protein n=1 Tax=Marinicella sp. W31 TaxID=3023713 RepID=UPI0037572D40